MHAILHAPVARLEVHGNVWQPANDDVESEWTDEVAGVISHPHSWLSRRRLHGC